MRWLPAGFVLLLLLGAFFYPVAALDQRVAPEASLRSSAPWRIQWGPYPAPSPDIVEAATALGPRLASIVRGGVGAALWNPWIGGGRPGWLASATEGGTPLCLVAATAARPGWAWTGLISIEITAAFVTSALLFLGLGLRPWAAAVGALSYALSGPVVGSWLSWQGSAFALGPAVLLPVVADRAGGRRGVALWGISFVVLGLCGEPAVGYVALSITVVVLSPRLLGRKTAWRPLVVAALLAGLALSPRLWLAAIGGEAGVAAAHARPTAALSWHELLTQPLSDPTDQQRSRSAPDDIGHSGRAGYVGVIGILLALVGLVLSSRRQRWFWAATAAVAAAFALVPAALASAVGVTQRPVGVLALAIAFLTAAGIEALAARLAPTQEVVLTAIACLAIFGSLGPAAAARVPFASPEESALQSPLAGRLTTDGSRVAALLETMPPDVAATVGLADVRAASFDREPRYTALLDAGPTGQLSATRALDPSLARLGARFLLEPLPLRVVSSGIFSGIEMARPAPVAGRSLDGLVRLTAEVPSGACRVGIAVTTKSPTGVWIERPGRRRQLDPDNALAAESDRWVWYALPPAWPAGPAVLALADPPARFTENPSVAWDSSGLRLRREERGVRVWELDRVRPAAFLATGIRATGNGWPTGARDVVMPRWALDRLGGTTGRAGGHFTAISRRPARLDAEGTTDGPALLVIQVKYRPRLWRAEVNGRPIDTLPADEVWTGIPLPAGGSSVQLTARLPGGVWLASGLAVAILGACLVSGRGR